MKRSFLLFAWFLAGTALLWTSCNPDDSMDPPDDPSTPEVEFYFNAKIDGQSIKLEVTTLGNVNAGVSTGGSFGTDTCKIDYGGFLYNFNDDYPYLGADFNMHYIGSCADEGDVFHDLFPVGSYPFYQSSDPNTPGVQIGYTSANDVYFNSGDGPQSNWSFVLTDSEPESTIFGEYQKVTGTVTCTLYSDTGDVVELTEGEFSFHVEDWN
jgi:hypothetical protein